MRLLFALMSFSYLCLLVDETGFAQGDGSGDAALALMQQSCGSGTCHNGTVSPRLTDDRGFIDLDAIDSNVDLILTRLRSTNSPMPPWYAPNSQQLTQEQRETIVAFVETRQDPPDGRLPLERLNLPQGFQIELFADVTGARSLDVSHDGIVIVGTGGYSDIDREGRVTAILPLADGTRKSIVIARRLNNPNGVAIAGDNVYIAERGRITKIENILTLVRLSEGTQDEILSPLQIIRDNLPNAAGNHSWKYLGLGPDNKLYVPVGAPCNVCLDDPDTYASIFRMNLDGSDFEQVASGVRNTVGFDWHPRTGELWFTDNGRDLLGDNLPPDELNRLPQAGLHFGFPYCHGNGINDPQFFANGDCSSYDYRTPIQELGPHVAALGLAFYQGEQFPSAYEHQIFIAEHGSWNRRSRIGYRISLVKAKEELHGSWSTSYETFIDGWLDTASQEVWGRPVDVANYVDGSLLISDDRAGAVYRVSYKP